MQSTLFSLSTTELLNLEKVSGRNVIFEKRKLLTDNDPQIAKFRKYRATLESWASKQNVTNQSLMSLIRYGNGPGPITTKQYISAKRNQFSYFILDGNDPLMDVSGAPSSNTIFKLSSAVKPAGMTVSEDMIDTADGKSIFDFYMACKWLSGLSTKILTNTNRVYQFSKPWAKIEYALNLPTVLGPNQIDNFFAPYAPLSSGSFSENGVFTFKDPKDAERYSQPQQASNINPSRVTYRFFNDDEYVGSGCGTTMMNFSGQITLNQPQAAKELLTHFTADGPIILKNNFTHVEIKKGKSVVPIFTINPPLTSPETDTKPYITTITGEKGSGKSTLTELIHEKHPELAVIDSDDWGRWLYYNVTVRYGVGRNEAYIEYTIDENMADEYVPDCTDPSLFEKVMGDILPAYTHEQQSARLLYRTAFRDFYSKIVTDPVVGIRAFVAKMTSPAFDHYIVFTHSSLESNNILGILRNYKLRPFFDPDQAVLLRNTKPNKDIDIALAHFYSGSVFGETLMSIPQIMHILDNNSVVV